MLTVTINDVDFTQQVRFGSLRKRESVNQLVDIASFQLVKYGDRDYLPVEGDRAEIFDSDDIKIFSGALSTINKTTDNGAVLIYELGFVGDASLLESRQRVTERYTNTTGNAIIADLLTNYASDFDGTYVNADFEVASMTFNRVTLKDALQKLAKFSNYVFYVGYNKDLHFFPKYAEPAPLALSTTSANYIYDSLISKEDFSQIRNRVFVQGGLYQAPNRTETSVTQAGQKVFSTASRFASLPVVTANTVPKTVGVDYLDNEADFDCFWNYAEKYVRFKDSAAPSTGHVVTITAPPLYPLIYQVQDEASISRLGGDPVGVREYAINDQTIKTTEEAEARAIAELEAYANKIVDGSFSTYTSGLRAGQIIRITCPEKEISGEYVIQQIDFSMLSNEIFIYKVKFASLKTVKILDILIEQLRERQRYVDDRDDQGILRAFFINETISIAETVGRDVETDEADTVGFTEEINSMGAGVWVYGPYIPVSMVDDKFAAVLDLAIYQ